PVLNALRQITFRRDRRCGVVWSNQNNVAIFVSRDEPAIRALGFGELSASRGRLLWNRIRRWRIFGGNLFDLARFQVVAMLAFGIREFERGRRCPSRIEPSDRLRSTFANRFHIALVSGHGGQSILWRVEEESGGKQ